MIFFHIIKGDRKTFQNTQMEENMRLSRRALKNKFINVMHRSNLIKNFKLYVKKKIFW